MWWDGVYGFDTHLVDGRYHFKRVFDDEAIKKVIIDLPSFELQFQGQCSIKKPDKIDYVDYKAWHCSIIELIEADNFIDCLTDQEKEKQLKFALKEGFIRLGDCENTVDSWERCPIEIESSLLSLLEDDTLKKFDIAEKLLNFYYKTLYDGPFEYFLDFSPYFSFAYRVVNLFHKKLLTANGKSDSEKFKKLCQCTAERAKRSALGDRYYCYAFEKYRYDNETSILSVKKKF